MDPDFLREFLVLAGFAGLYIVGSIFLLRGYKTDLSAVANHGPRTVEGSSAPTPQRLNRRRKAIAREQAEKSAREQNDQ